MKSAIAIYRAGEVVEADEIYPHEVNLLGLACMECLEPVILVNRKNSCYFAHKPEKTNSPFCPLRVYSNGNGGHISYERMTRIFQQNVFQDALSTICGIATFSSLASPYKQEIDKLVQLMRQVWFRKRRCIHRSDLMTPPLDYLKKWTTTSKIVQTYVSVLSTDYPQLIITYESLKSDEHITTVLLLWKHLHLEQVKKDLRFLLQLSLRVLNDTDNVLRIKWADVNNETSSTDGAGLILQALFLLTIVPWLEVSSLLERAAGVECANCKKSYSRIDQLVETKCDECNIILCPYCRDRCVKCNVDLCKKHANMHRTYSCPDCGQTTCETRSLGPPQVCIECGDLVCSSCYYLCESCHEHICEDCYHGGYICESCNDNFCKDHPEDIQRVECVSCYMEFCDRCAEDSIFKCPECKKMICIKCCEECTDCSKEICEDCSTEHECSV